MHLRGKDIKYVVVYPDGREETLLSVPNYSFMWQIPYELRQLDEEQVQPGAGERSFL